MWILNLINRHIYQTIEFSDLSSRRKSDTVFICGTGSSILDITDDQWVDISSHDILSFRDFPKQHFVKADFHVTGEIDDVDTILSH